MKIDPNEDCTETEMCRSNSKITLKNCFLSSFFFIQKFDVS